MSWEYESRRSLAPLLSRPNDTRTKMLFEFSCQGGGADWSVHVHASSSCREYFDPVVVHVDGSS
jgi:hypothetical protein